MKKLITLLAFTMISNFIFAQTDLIEPPPPAQEQKEIERKNFVKNSRTNVSIRNNTNKIIHFAYVMYDNKEESWTSHGWYEIPAYTKQNLPLGEYKGAVYFYGRSVNGTSTWSDKWNFCIDNNKFEIINADKVNCVLKAKFAKLVVNPDVENKWTFNP